MSKLWPILNFTLLILALIFSAGCPSTRAQSQQKQVIRLSPTERETPVLYGALSDLDREGECWVIESFIARGIVARFLH